MSYKASTVASRRTLELRRFEAESDIRAGVRQCDVARTYGVSGQTAHRWAKRVRAGKSMAATKASGAPARVKRDALRLLFRSHGAYTVRQLQELIFNKFGVFYNVEHVRRLRSKLTDVARAEVELRGKAGA